MGKNNFQAGTDGLQMEGALIAPFYPILKAKNLFLDASGKILRKEYQIAIMYKGKELKTFPFKSLSAIHYSEYWDECCDAELTREAKRALQLYLQYCAKEKSFTEHYLIDRTGLLSTSPVIFAYGYDAIVTKENLAVMCSPSLPVFTAKQATDLSILLDYARSLITLEPGITDMLFIIRATCILKPIFKLQNYLVDFFVSILGVSGTQKSTYAKMYFVENAEQLLSFSFNNRKQVMERLEKYAGHAVVVDDYHPLARNYDREKQQAILDTLARKADSGEGAIGVMTGEYMEGSFSLQDRMIPIRTQKKENDNQEFSEKLRLLAKENYKLSTLMYLFSQRAYTELDSITAELQKQISISGNNIFPYRIARNLNTLKYTWEIFTRCFPEIETWSINQQIFISFQNLLETHMKYMEATRRLEYSADMTYEVYLMLSYANVYREYSFSDATDYRGCTAKEGCIYFTRLALENEMCKFLGRPVKAETIAAHLQKTSVLSEDNSAARTKKVSGKRYYVINTSRLMAYGKSIDCNIS